MKIGAAYIRVSTEDQLEFSPESQLRKIKEYAEINKIEIPNEFVFVDEGLSGKCAETRPGFMTMIKIAKMKPKPFDIILVWKFSRFARNRQDSIIYKSMLRKNYNIDVLSITEQLSKDPTSILVEALLEAMDEYYSINLAQEVKRGMNEKFSRGGIVSAPPIGYKMGENCFQVDKETAPIVEKIFKDFLNNVPMRQIAVNLNNMGMRSKRGNLFESRTIEYILTNPVYIGKLRRNLSGNDKSDRFHQGPNVVMVDSYHPPLIDFNTFNEVQKKIKKFKRSLQNISSSTNFMLKDLVYCSNCGGKLVQLSKGKSLQCCRYSKGLCNESHSISLSKLNQAVLQKIHSDLDFKNEELISININTENNMDNFVPSMLAKEQKKLQRIRIAYENGVDTLTEYKEKKESICECIKELQKKIDFVSKNNNTQFLNVSLNSLVSELTSDVLSTSAKNIILRSFISKIIFNRKESSIQIYYYI